MCRISRHWSHRCWRQDKLICIKKGIQELVNRSEQNVQTKEPEDTYVSLDIHKGNNERPNRHLI